jgi:hypothetical protein
MNETGLFEIIVAVVLIVGIYVVVRTLRLPGSFFKNQETFKDVRKRIEKENQE